MNLAHRSLQRVMHAASARAQRGLRHVSEAFGERLERFSGRADPLVPPSRLMFVGGGRKDFRALGDKWVQTFIRLAELRPRETVLDVGCGVGRMAVALSRYLSAEAQYDGFDIVPAGIEWCQREITSRFPQFRFQLVDLYNKEYNPAGTLRASEFRFPYADRLFDFVFLTSVFTHMLPADVRHYLAEIRRVLRPGGRFLATLFILDDAARRSIGDCKVEPNRRFAHDLGGFWAVDPRVPEAALAYTEGSVRSMFHEVGLAIREPIHYGSWTGTARGRSNHSQDIVIADAPAP